MHLQEYYLLLSISLIISYSSGDSLAYNEEKT